MSFGWGPCGPAWRSSPLLSPSSISMLSSYCALHFSCSLFFVLLYQHLILLCSACTRCLQRDIPRNSQVHHTRYRMGFVSLWLRHAGCRGCWVWYLHSPRYASGVTWPLLLRDCEIDDLSALSLSVGCVERKLLRRRDSKLGGRQSGGPRWGEREAFEILLGGKLRERRRSQHSLFRTLLNILIGIRQVGFSRPPRSTWREIQWVWLSYTSGSSCRQIHTLAIQFIWLSVRQQACNRADWSDYYWTKSAGYAFQNLYDEVRRAREGKRGRMLDHCAWILCDGWVIAGGSQRRVGTFLGKNRTDFSWVRSDSCCPLYHLLLPDHSLYRASNILGFELINEPWPGDVYVWKTLHSEGKYFHKSPILWLTSSGIPHTRHPWRSR